MAPADFLSTNALRCKAPPLPLGEHRFSYSVDAQAFKETEFIYTALPEPVLKSINPYRGPFSGGSIVSITGENIPDAPLLQCSFGHAKVPVTAYYNHTCALPPEIIRKTRD